MAFVNEEQSPEWQVSRTMKNRRMGWFSLFMMGRGCNHLSSPHHLKSRTNEGAAQKP